MRKEVTLKALSVALTTAMAVTVVPTNVVGVSAAELPTPVVSYDFEDGVSTGLTLNGEAKVATLEGNGVLQLSTKASQGATYAQFAKDAFASADFKDGVTLTAKIYITGYENDWSPIFMLGTGTIGGGAETDVSYHLSQGWSTEIRAGGDKITAAKYGSDVAAPYTWDYFSNEANRNKWLTLTTTISPTDLKVYIDDKEVITQASSEAADSAAYTNFLTSFNTLTGCYLGASYWSADYDVQGYMDNVAVFNSALSADQVAALAKDFLSSGSGDTSSTDEPSTDAPTDEPPTDTNDTTTDPGDTNDTPADSDDIMTPPTDTDPGNTDIGSDTNDTTDDANGDSEEEETEPTLNKKKANVKVGKTVKLKVKDAEGTVKWSSSNKKVAKVNKSGKVTGVKKGKATIKAKVDGVTLTCKVTVKK